MDFNLVQSYILKLPKIEELKDIPQIKILIEGYSERIVDEYLSKILEERHKKIVKSDVEEDLKKMDFSIDYYIKELKKGIEIEKGKSLKKVINCMGTIYSDYIGNRFYSKEVLDNFSKVFFEYTNMELDEENGKKTDIDSDFEKLLVQLFAQKNCLLVNNMGSAFYLLVDTIFKDKNIILSNSDWLYFSELKYGISDVIKNANGKIKIAGYLNDINIENYIELIEEKDDLCLYSEMFNGKKEFVSNVKEDEFQALKEKSKTVYITDKVYIETESNAIKKIGYDIKTVLEKKYDFYILELSKLGNFPPVGIIFADEESIEKMKKNFIYSLISLNKEMKVLLYFSIKLYLEKKVNKVWINETLAEDRVKDKNIKFIKNIEGKLFEKAEIELVETKQFSFFESMGDSKNENREFIKIYPLKKDVYEAEKELRVGYPIVLCWVVEDSLLLNIDLLKNEEIEILNKKLLEVL
ncbi:hypothetical protein [Haliovirga abyssi]|uniref:Uncharacterized protein n=1 Tax=Haliovirga abyssi TaxID=2996794 RepID=A0AAU9DBD3_9FUSO|nr:hypothetical protein [Haliovirga abyssi]BDU49517.1 hypothetical protein HLVA_00860 [Haliovirga abyssi]